MASNPIADMIMRLLREGPQRGLPMVESGGLSRYLNEASGGIQTPGSGRRAPNVSEIGNHPGFEMGRPDLEPIEASPPISRDPWFDEVDPEALLREAGPRGTIFLWGVKNGNRVRLDGPFASQDEANRALQRLQRNVDPRTGFRLEIGPDQP